MKTRQGFVSNSISSSFVVIAETDLFKQAVSKIKDERHQKILKAIAKKDNVLGKQVMIINEFSDSGGASNIFGYDGFNYEEYGLDESEFISENDEDDFCPSECLDVYQEELEKLIKKKENKDKAYIFDDGGIG